MARRSKLASNQYSHWPMTGLRVGFGLVWLVDAILKWLPGFRSDYMATIMGEADGQANWERPWFDFWIQLQHPAAVFLAYFVAVLETLIALALIVGFARKITYLGAIVLSLLIWGTAEGFGGTYDSGFSDIGTAIIYAMVFAALLGFSYYQGPAPYSVDRWLEQKISWWHWFAEIGAPNQHRAYAAALTVPPAMVVPVPDAPAPTPATQTAPAPSFVIPAPADTPAVPAAHASTR